MVAIDSDQITYHGTSLIAAAVMLAPGTVCGQAGGRGCWMASVKDARGQRKRALEGMLGV